MDFLGQHCSDVQKIYFGLFDPSVAPALLYYSYVPIICASLLIGMFVYLGNRKSLQARLLLVVVTLFVLWVLNVLVQWVAIHNSVLMLAWQLTAPIEIGLYLSITYFAYVFFFKRDLPFIWKLLFASLFLGVLAWVPSTLNVEVFDTVNCEGSNGLLWNYLYALEPVAIIFTILLGISAYRTESDVRYRKQILILLVAISLFESIFFASNYYGELSKAYEFNLWGPIGMFFFVTLVGYMIVAFRAFNVKLLAAQALVTATILVIASEYLFIQNKVNYILVTVTLLLTIVFGYLLVKSVQREVEQKDKLQKLTVELEKLNDQQVVLIHFITHQIKGFIAKSRNIFSMALEGDFGSINDDLKPILQAGFESDTKGAMVIAEILNAANIKSGKVTFTLVSFDLRLLVEEVAKDFKATAENKGLKFTIDVGTTPAMIKGDRAQLVNVFRNLIDNSIKYTLQGEINLRVRISEKTGGVIFETQDTGVGITPEDMKNLFTEGGHGKESTRVNVESTGFGLFIVKSILEAHNATIKAESEGAGKGSHFTVEFPSVEN